MRDLVVTLLITTPLPLVLLGRADIGILLWCWISYMSPHHLAWGFAYNQPFAQMVGIATLIGWLVSKDPKRLPGGATTLLLIAFAMWISLTTPFALAPDLAWLKWDRTLKSLLAAILTLCIMHGRQRIQWLVWVTAGSIAFFGIKGGLFTVLTGGSYRVFGPPESMIADNNQAAVAFLMVLPLLRYLQLTAARRVVRLALLAGSVLTLIAILGTYSRGAIIGLAAAGLLFWLKSRNKLLIAAGMAIAALGSTSLMPEEWFDRIHSTAEYQEDGSTLGRFDAWRHAATVAFSRPLLGGGFGTFSPDVFATYSPGVEWRAAHSIYFEVLGEQGFVGLALFLMLLLVGLLNGRWIIRHARGRAELRWAQDLARMLQVSIAGYAVGGAFLSLGYFDLFYGLVVLMALTRLEVARAVLRPAEPTAAPIPGRQSRPLPQGTMVSMLADR